VLIEIAKNGGATSSRSLLTEISGSTIKNDGSSKLTFSLADFAQAVGLTVPDLVGGDAFTIYNVVELNNGLVFPDTIVTADNKQIINLGNVFSAGVPTSYTLQLSFTVVCPSNIAAGAYSAVSTATSTDGCPPTNPLVDYAYDVTLTKDGTASYKVSDFFGGVYINWYGDCYGYTFETPADFTDVCSTLVFSFADAFGATVQGTGTYNPGTGVITYTWTNDFGDTGTTTLTPK
jgi:hypothetical protein